ncbi:MAG: AAA family ATPase, partial [Armatimonadetes bacterium]|nr:AAA family ATPase [Armatimonadota bacterium]
MLVELAIHNFALIDELTVSFRPGLSVLTGETGAGKSILIDALSAALGERISTEAIRTGAETATVDAVFDAADCPRALAALEEAGLAADDGGQVVLARQIASGRSQCRVNGRPVTLATLQDISRHLVDVHGQHEHQALIHEENHLEFLDHTGAAEHLALRQEYESRYAALSEARAALAALRNNSREREQRLDMLRFQVREIAQAELRAEEEDELLAERQRLNSVEKLRELAGEALELLDGSEDAPGAGAALAQIAGAVQRLAEIDPSLRPHAEELRAAATV